MAKSASAEKAASEARDFTSYADKPATDLQKRFTDWILEKTGFEPDDMASFEEGVRLAVALRMAFQASPENQAALEERRQEALAKKSAPKKKAAKKAAPAPKAEVEEEEPEEDADADDETEVEEQPVKRKPGKRVKAKVEEVEEDDEGEAAPF